MSRQATAQGTTQGAYTAYMAAYTALRAGQRRVRNAVGASAAQRAEDAQSDLRSAFARAAAALAEANAAEVDGGARTPPHPNATEDPTVSPYPDQPNAPLGLTEAEMEGRCELCGEPADADMGEFWNPARCDEDSVIAHQSCGLSQNLQVA